MYYYKDVAIKNIEEHRLAELMYKVHTIKSNVITLNDEDSD